MDLNNIISWAKFKKLNNVPNNINSVYNYLQTHSFVPLTLYRDDYVTPFGQAYNFLAVKHKDATECVYYLPSNKGRLKSLQQMIIFTNDNHR